MEQHNETEQSAAARAAAATAVTDDAATAAATAAQRLPYTAPAVEVISVRTERGYAASLGDRGNHRW